MLLILIVELSSWNLMTRTNLHYQHISYRLTLLWFFGGILRYFILLPARLCILSVGLFLLCTTTAFVGYIPNKRLVADIGIAIITHLAWLGSGLKVSEGEGFAFSLNRIHIY